MDIRQVTNGIYVRTRGGRNGEAEVLIVEDNYWNRKYRNAYHPAQYKRTTVRTIDIAEASSGCVNGERLWEPVTLTPAQQKQLSYQRHLEYVTSPESETYWAS